MAALAKVAVGTVSRVLNTPESVGQEIRQRVLDSISQLNYQRLRRRRVGARPASASPRRGNLGVVLFGMDDSLTHLPVIAEALHGVELATAGEGLSLMLANVPGADRVPAFLAQGQVDGLIVKSPLLGDLTTCASPALIEAVQRLPHVWLIGRPDSAKGDVCGVDSEAGARIAADYLWSKGHRRIGYLHPRPGQTRAEGLKSAFSLQAQRRGMSLRFFEKATSGRIAWPLPAITNPNDILPLIEKWKAMPATARPTALLVPADSIAVQIYAALEQMGLKAGRDLSLLSFNHEKPLVMGLNPALATIDIRAEVIGRRAVEQLLWRLRRPSDDTATRIMIEPRLVEGGSVAALENED
ncbi:MAG: LacI family DNA-binding transcriptional regulator [Opitutaceae bacterium]